MFNDFSSILESVIHRRDSSLESVSEEQNLNPLIYEQHTDGNAENNDGKMLTLPMEEIKDTTYQGMKTQTTKLVKLLPNIIPR